MQCIPAIDLIGGRCVRLKQGDYRKETVYGDPVDIAKGYEAVGLERLHLVDLDGAKGNRIENLNVLSKIAYETSLVIDFGGGIKDERNLRDAFNAGASMVTCGSAAVERPEDVLAWKNMFGADKLIIGCDLKDGLIATHGWKQVSRWKTDAFVDFYLKSGLSLFLITDVGRDGMLSGPALGLYRSLQAAHPAMRIIASGGVSSLDDIRSLGRAGLYGVVVGKALLSGAFSAVELKEVGDAC